MKIMIRKGTVEDLELVASIESRCFPPAEAASAQDFKTRLACPADRCYIGYQEDGEVIGFVNGALFDRPELPDELYHSTARHCVDGAWQTLFGLNVLPEFRRKGYARQMMQHFLAQSRKEGRLGAVLTCKDHLRPFYESLGFCFQGVSESTHGGAKWNDMVCRF